MSHKYTVTHIEINFFFGGKDVTDEWLKEHLAVSKAGLNFI